MQYIPQMYFSDMLSRSNHRVTKLLCYFDNNNLCAFKVQLITALIWNLQLLSLDKLQKTAWKTVVTVKFGDKFGFVLLKKTLTRGVEYFKTLENWLIVLNLLGCKTPRLCLWIRSNLNLKPFQYDIDTLNLSNEM